jgi:DNA-binding transcriptional regulator YiaG
LLHYSALLLAFYFMNSATFSFPAMARRSVASTSLVGRVRAWFGLVQADLALYLGISAPLVRDLEAGCRQLTPAVRAALLPLLL